MREFLKKLMVFSLLSILCVTSSACGNSLTSTSEETVPEVGVEDENGWTRINPKGDKSEVIFSTDKTDISAIVEGTILGQYYFDDVEFIVSKPILPEEVRDMLERYKYNHVMVMQSGGDLLERYQEDGGFALILLFSEDLEIRAHDHSGTVESYYSGGQLTNFEYKPENEEGMKAMTYVYGHADDFDPIDVTNHEDKLMSAIYVIERYN